MREGASGNANGDDPGAHRREKVLDGWRALLGLGHVGCLCLLAVGGSGVERGMVSDDENHENHGVRDPGCAMVRAIAGEVHEGAKRLQAFCV
jgi:hypothetical protein